MLSRRRFMASAVLMGLLSAAACDKKDGEGPAERAGKEIDKAVEQARPAVEKAKDAAKATANEVTDKTDAAAEATREAVQGNSK